MCTNLYRSVISGQVTNISESHDGAHLFSGGDDGNLFGYLSLAHDQIIKSMEGKRAKLPTPKVKWKHMNALIEILHCSNATNITSLKNTTNMGCK